MNLIDIGIDNGLIRFDENRDYNTYIYQNKKRNYNNPEKKVQAETFLTLALIFGYPVDRIKKLKIEAKKSNPLATKTENY